MTQEHSPRDTAASSGTALAGFDHTTETGEVFATAARLYARYGGVSHMWLQRKMREANFPRPVRIGGGNIRFWRLSEVLEWERNQIVKQSA